MCIRDSLRPFGDGRVEQSIHPVCRHLGDKQLGDQCQALIEGRIDPGDDLSLIHIWDFLYWLRLSAVCLESGRYLQGYSRPEPVGQCLKCCLYLLL